MGRASQDVADSAEALALYARDLGVGASHVRALVRHTLGEAGNVRRAVERQRRRGPASASVEELRTLNRMLARALACFRRLSEPAKVRLPITSHSRDAVGAYLAMAKIQVSSALADELPSGPARTALHEFQFGLAVLLEKLGVPLPGTDESPWVSYIVEASKIVSGIEPDRRKLQQRLRREVARRRRDLGLGS